MAGLFGKNKNSENHVDELSSEGLKALADLLRMPYSRTPSLPSEEWLREQNEIIAKQLPKELKRHGSSKLTVFLHVDNLRKLKLCAAHIDLEPRLINDIFQRLKAEFTDRLHRIRLYRNRSPNECCPQVKSFPDRLSGIYSLYSSPGEFDEKFGTGHEPSCGFQRIPGECAACVLAVISSRPDLLSDLRASLRSRMREHARHQPTLLPLVEAWIECFGREFGVDKTELLLAQSNELLVKLKDIRKIMGKRREAHKSQWTEWRWLEDGRRRANKENSSHRGGRPLKTNTRTRRPSGEEPYYTAGGCDQFFTSDSEDEGDEAGYKEYEEEAQEPTRPAETTAVSGSSTLFQDLTRDVRRSVDDPTRSVFHRYSANFDAQRPDLKLDTGKGKERRRDSVRYDHDQDGLLPSPLTYGSDSRSVSSHQTVSPISANTPTQSAPRTSYRSPWSSSVYTESEAGDFQGARAGWRASNTSRRSSSRRPSSSRYETNYPARRRSGRSRAGSVVPDDSASNVTTFSDVMSQARRVYGE